jgi:sulfatase maturation enzyme AslB (radical SAM superfamily)
MGKDLKAENLAVCVPNFGCNKNCPYCVSRMTGYIKADLPMVTKNIRKVVEIAKKAEVTSVLFTGKGEPTHGESLVWLNYFTSYFRDFPMELQTNGINLLEQLHILDELYNRGMDVIAVSVDSYSDLIRFRELFQRIKNKNMISRLVINATLNFEDYGFLDILYYCIRFGIRQLTFRKLTIPEGAEDTPEARWINENNSGKIYDAFMSDLKGRGRLIRKLKSGLLVYDIEGVAVTYSDYCLQESDEGDNIRSLIFQEDGHLYTSWNSKASILF